MYSNSCKLNTTFLVVSDSEVATFLVVSEVEFLGQMDKNSMPSYRLS